jgi:hypothetical protein
MFPRPNIHVSKAKRACFKCKTTRIEMFGPNGCLQMVIIAAARETRQLPDLIETVKWSLQTLNFLGKINGRSCENRQCFISDCSSLVASDGHAGKVSPSMAMQAPTFFHHFLDLCYKVLFSFL